jgi:hypothetical protein
MTGIAGLARTNQPLKNRAALFHRFTRKTPNLPSGAPP